jgi:predicted translin family RNA/ssDNA-binding protein
MDSIKNMITERLQSVNSKREENVIISRALFEDLVATITKLPIEDVQKMSDSDKEIILLKFSEKN